MSAIRLGDYKLVKNLNTNEIRLFNVVEDIEESKDLVKSMPEKATDAKEKQRIQKLLKDMPRRIEVHKSGLEVLEKTRQIKSW